MQSFAIVTFFVVSLFAGTPNNCQGQTYTYEDDLEYYLPTLTLDDSHDLVRLIKDGDEIEIEIFMFDANEFDSIPNTLDFELLEDLASEYDKFDIDLDELQGLNIYLKGGDDVLYSDQDLELALGVLGGDGDDFIQGASGDDRLFGGRGSDKMFGFGGSDLIGGGDPFAEHEDYERDYFWGGAGADIFGQTTIKVMYQYFITNLGTRGGSTPTAVSIWTTVSLDRIMDFQSWQDEVVNLSE